MLPSCLRAGETILNRYQVLRPVRSGGLAVVYKAKDLRLGDLVAVKIIHVHGTDAGMRHRIAREIEVLGRLSHRHIVECRGSGELGEDRVGLVLEWLDGEDLADFKARAPLTLRFVLELAEQVADALAFAHDLGVVHRDIKPANLFLRHPSIGASPDLRVLDFGVAKVMESGPMLTRAGAILGTPSYMAPEQANAAMTVDGRADVFSLGVVLYELLAGKLPWASSTDLARLARITVETAAPVLQVCPELPEPVAELIDSMLVVDPADRIDSAVAVRDLARGFLDVLSPAELDTVHARDQRAVANLVRAETVNLGSGPTGPLPDTNDDLEEPEPAGATQLLERDQLLDEGVITGPLGVVVEAPIEATQLLGRAPAAPSPPPLIAPALFGPPLPKMVAVDRSTYLGEARGDPWGDVRSTQDGLDAQSEPSLPALPVVQTAPLEAAKAPLLSAVELRGEIPFYGRVAELERLKSRTLAAVSGGRPSLTVVAGAAGLGKTRLRNELAKALQASHRPIKVYAARAEENRRSAPYAFLRRMLVNPNDPPEARRARLLELVPKAAMIREILSDLEPRSAELTDPTGAVNAAGRTHFFTPDLLGKTPTGTIDVDAEEERATVAAFAARALQIHQGEVPLLLAVLNDPRQLAEQIRRALDILLVGLAHPGGLIVLVDDAHLLDHESARVLTGLLRPDRQLPIAVVAFGPAQLLSEESRDRSPLGDLEELHVETMDLLPLEARASREMTRALVKGEVEASSLELLVTKTEGNPLFLEQLVRAVQANGVLGPGLAGELRLNGLAHDESDVDRVPPTISAAVSTRLAAMPHSLQKVLTASAVFGEVFWAEGVARVTEQPLANVELDLDRLLLANMVRRRSRPRYQDQHELEFTHAVIRSVALSRLKRKRRHGFEARAAEYLLSVGESERAVLAGHVAQSGEIERATELYVEAAEAALSLGDHVSACRVAEEGLLLAEGTGATGPLLRLHGVLERVALATGDWELGRDALDALQDLAENDGARADLYERRSRLAFLATRFEEARLEAEEAKKLRQKHKDQAGLAAAELLVADAALALGDRRSALRSYLSAQARFTELSAPAGLARTARGLARIALASGDYGTAESRFKASLVQARALRAPEGIATANLGLAEVARLLGEGSRAKEFLEEARRSARTQEDRAMLRLHQAWLLLEEHRYEDAYARVHATVEGLRLDPGLGGPRRLGALLLGLSLRRRPGSERHLRGDPARLEGVQSILERAYASAAAQEPALVPALGLARALVAALQGDESSASSLAEEARGRFQREGALAGDEPAGFAYGYARILQLLGAPDDAIRTAFSEAVMALDTIGSRLERKPRQRYLERPVSVAILEDAERAGVQLQRDTRSNRITTG